MEVCNIDCGLMVSHRLNVFDVVLVKGCRSKSQHGPYARSTSYCSKLGTTWELWSASTYEVSKYTIANLSRFELWKLVSWILVLELLGICVGGLSMTSKFVHWFPRSVSSVAPSAPSASALKIVIATCNPVSGPVVPSQIYSPCCGSILTAVSFLSNICISKLFYPCNAYFFLNNVAMPKPVVLFLLYCFLHNTTH